MLDFIIFFTIFPHFKTEKFSHNVGDHHLFWKSPHDGLLFGIQHYAGQVRID